MSIEIRQPYFSRGVVLQISLIVDGEQAGSDVYVRFASVADAAATFMRQAFPPDLEGPSDE